jgi:formamidopyrimidine-DNA glycosylase
MPELPEVEVVRRGLVGAVGGRMVSRLDVRESRLRWPVPADMAALVRGERLEQLDRRGKYLLFGFSTGWMIVHLGMSGRLTFQAAPQPAGKHDHVDVHFEHGTLRYHDPRRFGALLWHPRSEGPPERHALLRGLGIEPFHPDFSGALLHAATRGRRVSVKTLLLTGQIVVGVGNIYASESLFRAGIRPTTRADRISLARYERLAQAIRDTLAAAIERGGSSLRDFVDSDGRTGYFQLEAFVYGRAGAPCRRCGHPIRMTRQQQRATFWCAVCQS